MGGKIGGEIGKNLGNTLADELNSVIGGHHKPQKATANIQGQMNGMSPALVGPMIVSVPAGFQEPPAPEDDSLANQMSPHDFYVSGLQLDDKRRGFDDGVQSAYGSQGNYNPYYVGFNSSYLLSF